MSNACPSQCLRYLDFFSGTTCFRYMMADSVNTKCHCLKIYAYGEQFIAHRVVKNYSLYFPLEIQYFLFCLFVDIVVWERFVQ